LALLLYVGRLAPEKNLDILPAMMERLSCPPCACRLLVVGDGIERERLAAAAARGPGTIAFLGHVGDREALSRIYANCDLFIHPNPSEPFGIAPLEAMASGLPVVAPNSGGIKSYANECNSYLVNNSADAFAAAVRSALKGPGRRIAKGINARQTAQQFTWQAVTDSFLELYDSIYAARSGQVPLRQAGPAFSSTAADSVQTATTTLLAQTAKAGFRLYSRLARRRAGRPRPSRRLVHPQEVP
jgi:glycosyltransferase involved in cell wall biosynthesis